MKKTLLILLATLFAVSLVNAQAIAKKKANKDTERFRYEIECAGNGAQGTFLVKVWSYSKKKQVAADQCLKNAVHGIVFKGYSGANGCVAQRPLVTNPGVEMEYEDYFKSFFDSKDGNFRRYASALNGTYETVKVGKEYKIGTVISVRKDELRKALEQAGVIKALNAGF